MNNVIDNDIMDGLNSSQRKAAETLEGPLLVLAGAGTGKTRVITFRIANLLKNWVLPENILGLTFTNKAAREMRERVRELVDVKSAGKIFLGTFHSFCLQLLKSEIPNISLSKGFTIANDKDQEGIIKQAIAETGLTNANIPAGVYRSMIGSAKNEMTFSGGYKREASGTYETCVARVYEKYQEILHNQNMLDFDDILMMTVKLWMDNPDVLEKHRDKYKYLLVDEFQDTNHVQFKLIELLAGNKKNVCVVGDDDQSIYGWRGALVENILDFPKHFRGAKVIKLEQNYRSTNTILEAANSFISGNVRRHEKSLWSDRGDGEKIKIHCSYSDIAEAQFVAESIYSFRYNNPGLRYSNIAILYRSKHQSRLFEKEFRKENIPYKLVGRSFFDSREIRDSVAYLKIIANPKDDQNFLRIVSVPPRGIGSKSIADLRELQTRKRQPLTKLINDSDFHTLISTKGGNSAGKLGSCLEKWREQFSEPGDLAMKAREYFSEVGFLDGFQRLYKKIDEAESRRENVLEFINDIARFEDNFTGDAMLEDFFDNFDLADDNDKVENEEESDDSVTMLTVHASKGLEFPYIFVVGMEQNLFPHARALEERDTDEERRLFYVAVTRAKDKLVLSHSAKRYYRGKDTKQYPSEFLDQLPEELVDGGKEKKKVTGSTVSDAFSNWKDQFLDDI